MTLLGWMHRKLRSNHDVFKEFNTGGGGACNCITGLASPDNEYFGDDAFAANHPSPPVTADEHFTFSGSGLLAIGTLGFADFNIPSGHEDNEEYDDVDVLSLAGTVDEADDGAVTPTFTCLQPEVEDAAVEKDMCTIEAIAEKDDDTPTEDDLLLVSAELEKVLGGSDIPSARVSFAMGVDCPLQGFLFGSPVCSDTESRPDKPDGGGRRTSLGELFMRTRFTDEKGGLVAVAEGEDGGERDEGKHVDGDDGRRRKRMKKRRVKDEKGAGGDGEQASATTKSKLKKILQMFHRKVYPENTILTKKNRKRGGSDHGATDESMASPKTTRPRMLSLVCCTKRSFSSSPDDSGELNANKSGHWIKTDADYLVLEL